MLIQKYKKKLVKKFHKITNHKYNASYVAPANNNIADNSYNTVIESVTVDTKSKYDSYNCLKQLFEGYNIGGDSAPALIENFFSNIEPEKVYNILSDLDSTAKFYKHDLYWYYYTTRSLLSYSIWDSFAANCKDFYNSKNPENKQSKIKTLGLLSGTMNKDIHQELFDEYKKCELKKYTAEDFTEFFMFNPSIYGDATEQFNKFASFKESSENLKLLLKKLLDSLKNEFETEMGHYFNVVGVRAFELCPLRTTIGPHMWHKDSHPACAKKMMIYLSETNEESGSTQYQLYNGTDYKVEGDGGNWILFSNSLVRHRGLPPLHKNRPIIELTIAPALETNTDVLNSGLNSIFPWFPLTRDIESNREYFTRNYIRALQLAVDKEDVVNASARIDNILSKPR